MRTIDIHAHITPEAYIAASRKGEAWHGIPPQGVSNMSYNPRTTWTPQERIADMNSLGVDVQVLSTNASFYNYDMDASVVAAMSRDCNDYVAQLTKDHPERFSGFATLPMQDVAASVAELERSMNMGLKGAMIGDQVNGKTFDEPEFMPLWKSAEASGAVMLIHQGGNTIVSPRSDRYHLPNTIGNLADRAVTFASFVFGGVMDACPGLRVCLCHGGGYTCYGIGRMDRGWQVRREARDTHHRSRPPRTSTSSTTTVSPTARRPYATSSTPWASTGWSSAPTGPSTWRPIGPCRGFSAWRA